MKSIILIAILATVVSCDPRISTVQCADMCRKFGVKSLEQGRGYDKCECQYIELK